MDDSDINVTESDFAIAASFVTYSGEKVTPDIGELKFVIKSWESSEDQP